MGRNPSTYNCITNVFFTLNIKPINCYNSISSVNLPVGNPELQKELYDIMSN